MQFYEIVKCSEACRREAEDDAPGLHRNQAMVLPKGILFAIREYRPLRVKLSEALSKRDSDRQKHHVFRPCASKAMRNDVKSPNCRSGSYFRLHGHVRSILLGRANNVTETYVGSCRGSEYSRWSFRHKPRIMISFSRSNCVHEGGASKLRGH